MRFWLRRWIPTDMHSLARRNKRWVCLRRGHTAIPCTCTVYLWHEQTSCQSVPVCLVSNGILILICVFERVLVYNQKKTTCLQSLTSTFKTFSLHSSGLRKQTGLPLTVIRFPLNGVLGVKGVLGATASIWRPFWRARAARPGPLSPRGPLSKEIVFSAHVGHNGITAIVRVYVITGGGPKSPPPQQHTQGTRASPS